jgi:hypothetical protein
MRKLLNRKIVEQDRKCAICHEEFADYNDIVPDHRDPKGMGGSWGDDHPDNIQATHWWCNSEKGSNRLPTQGSPQGRTKPAVKPPFRAHPVVAALFPDWSDFAAHALER